jgi:hypothetical protein
MDFNTSVPQPASGLEIRPPQLQSPLETLAQMQEIRARKQQMETAALQQQAVQMDINQRKAINQAYQDAFSVQPDGSYQLDKDKLTSSLAKNGHGEAIPGIMENWTKYQQSLATLQETNQKVSSAEADAAGNLAATVQAARNDPALFHSLVTDAMNRKIINQSHFAPLDKMITDSLAQDPTGEQARTMVGQLTDQMIAGSPKQQELASARTTAEARKAQAATSADREKREAAQQDFLNGIASLGAIPPQSAAEYQQRVGQLSPATAQRILAAVPVSQYDPAKSGDTIRKLGMTPDQLQVTGEQARHNQVEEANAAQRESREAAQGQERIGIEEANSRRMQRQFDATYGSLLGPNGEQLSPEAQKAMAEQDPAAKAIANYQMAPPSLSRGVGSGIMRKVMAINPSYDAKNWKAQSGMLDSYTSGAKSKEISGIVTSLGHIGVLGTAIDALHNHDVQLMNRVANFLSVQTGGDAVTTFNAIVHKVAPELNRAYVGGVGAEGEIKSQESDFNPALGDKQLRNNVAITTKLLRSKIGSIEQQWKTTMNRDDFGHRFMTPEAKAALDRWAPEGGAQAAPPLPQMLSAQDKGKVYTNRSGQRIKITDVNPQNPKQFKAEVQP